jgi:hypothetical protein
VASTHKLDKSALAVLLRSTGGPVAKDMLRRGINVQTRARKNLAGGGSVPRRINTGRLRNSISVELRQVGGKLTVAVGTNVSYAIFVHDGTGIWGPRHRLIKPRNGKVLRWKGKTKTGKKGYIYARYTRGMERNPFLRDALPAAAL